MRSSSARSSARRKRRNSGPFREGAAAVEFAIVCPLFLLLLAGIIEFGMAFRIQHMLSSASRRGARAAIVDKATLDGVQTLVKNHCVRTLGVSSEDVTVEIERNGSACQDLGEAEEGDEISLSVKLPYSKAGTGFFANWFSNSILTSTSTLEHE